MLVGPLDRLIQSAPFAVHIIYLDESGTQREARHFVLAGLAVFERETYFLAQQMEELQRKYFPTHRRPVNLHASELGASDASVKPPFHELPMGKRIELLREVYPIIAASRSRLFGVVIEKAIVPNGQYERGFEEVVSRFDRMLSRFYQQGDQQRGLIVVAESSYKENLELLARKIAEQGHRWGETHNLADIPYFAPAGSTRLLQLADFVSNAIFRRYESGDARAFDVIAPRFDQESGRIHGLVHLTADRSICYCPVCVSRRASP